MQRQTFPTGDELGLWPASSLRRLERRPLPLLGNQRNNRVPAPELQWLEAQRGRFFDVQADHNAAGRVSTI
jgi:hypothetical protein